MFTTSSFLFNIDFSLKTRLNSKETGLRLFSLTTVVKHSFVTFCRHFCELFKAFLSTSWGKSFPKECGSQRKLQFYCIFSLAVKRKSKNLSGQSEINPMGMSLTENSAFELAFHSFKIEIVDSND